MRIEDHHKRGILTARHVDMRLVKTGKLVEESGETLSSRDGWGEKRIRRPRGKRIFVAEVAGGQVRPKSRPDHALVAGSANHIPGSADLLGAAPA